MKSKIIGSLFVLLLVFSIPIGCGVPPPATEPPTPAELERQGFLNPEIPRITCYQLKQKMDAGDLMYVVDVRPEFLYELGHLPNTLNIPSEEWKEASEEEIANLLTLPKDRFIVLYCD